MPDEDGLVTRLAAAAYAAFGMAVVLVLAMRLLSRTWPEPGDALDALRVGAVLVPLALLVAVVPLRRLVPVTAAVVRGTVLAVLVIVAAAVGLPLPLAPGPLEGGLLHAGLVAVLAPGALLLARSLAGADVPVIGGADGARADVVGDADGDVGVDAPREDPSSPTGPAGLPSPGGPGGLTVVAGRRAASGAGGVATQQDPSPARGRGVAAHATTDETGPGTTAPTTTGPGLLHRRNRSALAAVAVLLVVPLAGPPLVGLLVPPEPTLGDRVEVAGGALSVDSVVPVDELTTGVRVSAEGVVVEQGDLVATDERGNELPTDLRSSSATVEDGTAFRVILTVSHDGDAEPTYLLLPGGGRVLLTPPSGGTHHG